MLCDQAALLGYRIRDNLYVMEVKVRRLPLAGSLERMRETETVLPQGLDTLPKLQVFLAREVVPGKGPIRRVTGGLDRSPKLW
jgi:hypothetical protein